YVIIGAGSAGCVLANRLTEDSSSRVLLIEAGGRDWSPYIHVPAGFMRLLDHPTLTWRYYAEPDPGTAGRAILYPRGRVLGGSSSINGLIYVRGQPEDFDHWAQLGNRGWSWDDVLPFFKKAENWEGGESDVRGVGGPLFTSKMDRSPLCEAVIEAGRQIGLEYREDVNNLPAGAGDSIGWCQQTRGGRRRASAARTYLRPAMKRPNLRVITHAMSERVLLEGRRAVGVTYRQGGVSRTVRARREVVVCGGALNSPQLLMLSGIGPAAHLAEHGIEVRHDLPGVGQSMQDHYQARIVLKCRFPITVNDIMMSKTRMVMTGLDYLLRRKGPLTIAAAQAGLFARTRAELETPDVQYATVIFSADRPAEGLHKFSGFSLVAYQLRPESRGELKLKSADPSMAPAMHPNSLTTETDRRTIIDGLKLARRLLATPDMQHFIIGEYIPGEYVQTDDELLAYARQYGGTVFHPTSTCKMGSDPMAVVDAALHVHGLQGLRVVDASIMPAVVSGNTNAATIMIAEKAADMMRQGAREGMRAAA
ncbi:MAG TPA: GMC family oxidoreductase N-terminal domain-containing protein, partial [Acetobacteraceae bacterium]